MVPELARRRFGLDRAPQFRIRQRGFRERDVLLSRSARDHAREPIGFTIGKSNDAANVAHRALRIHFVERHNLRDPAFAIFLADVFQHFAAPVLTKIDVDIGRRNSFRIQESLKDQSELKRIDIRDSQNVGDERPGRGTTTRSHRNSALLREMDEVPDDQKITDESGALQNVDLVVEPLDQFRIRPGAFPVPFVQTFVTKLAQISLARLSFRHRVFGIFRNAELQFQIDSVGNSDRVRDCLGVVRKQRPHFIGRLEIEVRLVAHSPLIVDHPARPDANHHVVSLVMTALEKMDVVRRD